MIKYNGNEIKRWDVALLKAACCVPSRVYLFISYSIMWICGADRQGDVGDQ